MDLTNVVLTHEEIHLASVDKHIYKIYISEIEKSGLYLVVSRKTSTVEFAKDKEVFVAITKDLVMAREKALEVKKKIIDSEKSE